MLFTTLYMPYVTKLWSYTSQSFFIESVCQNTQRAPSDSGLGEAQIQQAWYQIMLCSLTEMSSMFHVYMLYRHADQLYQRFRG